MNRVKDALGERYVPDAIAFTDEVTYTDTENYSEIGCAPIF